MRRSFMSRMSQYAASTITPRNTAQVKGSQERPPAPRVETAISVAANDVQASSRDATELYGRSPLRSRNQGRTTSGDAIEATYAPTRRTRSDKATILDDARTPPCTFPGPIFVRACFILPTSH